MYFFIFFFNDTATTEISTLPLHDALPISPHQMRTKEPKPRLSTEAGEVQLVAVPCGPIHAVRASAVREAGATRALGGVTRSEEHTSELQSRQYLVCRLLLEKKKKHTVIRY